MLLRSLLTSMSYLAQDRAHLTEGVKPLMRMVSPKFADPQSLRTLVQHLLLRPREALVRRPQIGSRMSTICGWRRIPTSPEIYLRDCAGDLLTRRSTMGIAVFLGSHFLMASSHLQSTVSLSICEQSALRVCKGPESP